MAPSCCARSGKAQHRDLMYDNSCECPGRYAMQKGTIVSYFLADVVRLLSLVSSFEVSTEILIHNRSQIFILSS